MAGEPDPRPASSRKRPDLDRDARLRFKIGVLASDGRCLAHDDPAACQGDFHVHHVITQAQLRHHDLHDRLWDPSNGICLCELAHRRHHRGLQRLARERLPQRCLLFAERFGLTHLIDRYYPSAESASMRP